MSKTHLLHKLLLLLALVLAGEGTAWAQATVNTVLWSETWTGGETYETPSNYGFEGTYVYGDATLTYSQSDSNTKLYSSVLAGGDAPELLLSKSNKTWTISGIPTGDAKEMTLTFLSNKSAFDLTSSTSGIKISGSGKSWTIRNTGNVSIFNLTLKNTSSNDNARIDNIELKVKTVFIPVAGYTINFENASGHYIDWTITNIEHSSESTTPITAHGGSYYGTTGGKPTASIQTKEKVAYPETFTCFFSKHTDNVVSSNWYIQVSSDGTTWENVKSQSATSMAVGTWVDFAADLTSYTDVYVRLYYDGNGAYRAVDDISLTTKSTVTFAASGFASFCSPLALDLTPTADYSAWVVTGTSGTSVTFSKITGAVPAETPFILYGKNFGGKMTTIPVASGETTPVAGNMLRGTLSPTAVTTEMVIDGQNYTLFGLSGGSFVKINDGTVPANKAYLPILTSNVPSGARLAIVFDDETTGIEEIENGRWNNGNAVYDMQGRRVSQPTKGLYIVNGKKVAIK